MIYHDESHLHLDFSRKQVCLLDQTLSSGKDIVNRDLLDLHHPTHLGLTAVQVIHPDTPLTVLKMQLTNHITDCLGQLNVLVCWIEMKEYLEGNMSQGQGTKKEDTTSASPDQNVKRDLRGTPVMRETMPEQGENIRDPKGQKDLRGPIENTVGLRLSRQIVPNVPRGPLGKTMRHHRAEEMQLHLAGMRLQLQQPQVSTLNEQHSFRVLKSHVLGCLSVGKLKKEIVLHDQPLPDAKMIVNMLREAKEKIDRKESLKHRVGMPLQHRQQRRQEILPPLVHQEIVVVQL